ncbi:hypothetical protein QQF64_008220 [Cirrhinus molitorella]|uniref:Secreted protein n=1 Tax=Cirrhinus molitorella TaxID=172907 RepID=A0ABR3M5I0_9TELE
MRLVALFALFCETHRKAASARTDWAVVVTTDNGTLCTGAARGVDRSFLQFISRVLPLQSLIIPADLSRSSSVHCFSVDFPVEMFVWGRTSFRQLQACFFRLLCFIPTGFPVISVDSQRSTDNITIRQGDTAVIRLFSSSIISSSTTAGESHPPHPLLASSSKHCGARSSHQMQPQITLI